MLLVFSILAGLGVLLGAVLPAPVAYAACPAGMLPLQGNDKVCCPNYANNKAADCIYAKYVNPAISVLSVLAGLAAVIGIVIGGIQYASSSGDPQKAVAARGKITKAMLGLLTFLFLYSLLQFFSPGGISSKPVPQGKGTIAKQCSKNFLTLKPWFTYLPDPAFGKDDKGHYTCTIENFSLLGEQDKDGKTTGSQLPLVVLAIIDDLVRVAGMVAVGFVIYGGVQFVTSQGDPEKAKRARQTVFNALIGVVIAIVAASVVSYIGSQLSS